MVQSHEYDVDHDTQGDEELGEGVEHDVGEELRGLEPQPAAIPDAGYIQRLGEVLGNLFLDLGTLPVVIIVVGDDRDVLGILLDGFNDVVQHSNVLENEEGKECQEKKN